MLSFWAIVAGACLVTKAHDGIREGSILGVPTYDLANSSALSKRGISCQPGNYYNTVDDSENGGDYCEVCPAGSALRLRARYVCRIKKELRDRKRNPINIGNPMPGFFNNKTDEAQMCERCEPGRFASDEASTSCSSCPIAYFQQVEASSFCDSCGEGPAGCGDRDDLTQEDSGTVPGVLASLLQADDSPDFTCAPGKYHDLGQGQFWAANHCANCPAGYFSPEESDAASCTPCAFGFFNARELQSKCSVCPRGFYQHDRGAGACDLCGGISAPTSASTDEDCDAELTLARKVSKEDDRAGFGALCDQLGSFAIKARYCRSSRDCSLEELKAFSRVHSLKALPDSLAAFARALGGESDELRDANKALARDFSLPEGQMMRELEGMAREAGFCSRGPCSTKDLTSYAVQAHQDTLPSVPAQPSALDAGGMGSGGASGFDLGGEPSGGSHGALNNRGDWVWATRGNVVPDDSALLSLKGRVGRDDGGGTKGPYGESDPVDAGWGPMMPKWPPSLLGVRGGGRKAESGAGGEFGRLVGRVAKLEERTTSLEASIAELKAASRANNASLAALEIKGKATDKAGGAQDVALRTLWSKAQALTGKLQAVRDRFDALKVERAGAAAAEKEAAAALLARKKGKGKRSGAVAAAAAAPTGADIPMSYSKGSALYTVEVEVNAQELDVSDMEGFVEGFKTESANLAAQVAQCAAALARTGATVSGQDASIASLMSGVETVAERISELKEAVVSLSTQAASFFESGGNAGGGSSSGRSLLSRRVRDGSSHSWFKAIKKAVTSVKNAWDDWRSKRKADRAAERARRRRERKEARRRRREEARRRRAAAELARERRKWKAMKSAAQESTRDLIAHEPGPASREPARPLAASVNQRQVDDLDARVAAVKVRLDEVVGDAGDLEDSGDDQSFRLGVLSKWGDGIKADSEGQSGKLAEMEAMLSSLTAQISDTDTRLEAGLDA